MSRDRVLGIVLVFAVANILVWIWTLVSPVLAALLVVGLEAAALIVYRAALRATERDLFRCRLELSTIRPDEREQAVLRLASQAVIQREGAFLPEPPSELPEGYGFTRLR